MERDSPSLGSHPLLDELRGVLRRLKCTPQPIRDGHDHLVPFCESLEAVFRSGLKHPNSWFGLNKQDYWAWIEPLQDYYFNEKQNPLLRDVVTAVASSTKLRTLQAKGRCFLRIALCQKLLSVPIEHLAKNERLTNYWYHSGSIISSPALRGKSTTPGHVGSGPCRGGRGLPPYHCGGRPSFPVSSPQPSQHMV